MKGSSQKDQWLQELQGATAATGHQQGVSRRPGGQGQQSSTTTNHGPRDPMFTDTAGQVPGRWLIPTKSASCTRSYYQPSADPGHYNNEAQHSKETNGLHARFREANQDARTGFVCFASHFYLDA